MIQKLNLILLFIAIVLSGSAQKKALESITENDLKAHLEFIASDNMQGREFRTPTPGLEITADYLKAQCKKIGLKPGGENYFQIVPMISVKPDTVKSIIQFFENDNELLYETNDFVEYVDSTTDHTIEGKLVFCGYGWKVENTGYNDFSEVDVDGKIVLIMTRNREFAMDTTKKGWHNELEDTKVKNIFELGAQAVLQCSDPLNTDFYDWLRGMDVKGRIGLVNKKFAYYNGQVIDIPRSFAEKILNTQGKTLKDLQIQINETGKPYSFELDNLEIKIKLSRITKAENGKNVIGILEGSDPVLKNECVIYTAHYDHLGLNETGEIFNGADDNGSGVAALLEIAEAFTKLKKSPKRSIVFIWTTAEEKGLFGSEYYTSHPVFPLENTLANINLDMVGRSASEEPEQEEELEKSLAGPNGMYIVSGKQSSELIQMSEKICNELGLIPSDKISATFLNRSDYFHFYKNGIPVLGLGTGLHEDYHQITDDVDKIDYNKMKRVADYAFLVGEKVANQKKRIVVDKPASK